jgi:multidrug efflux pump subunit AcrA (membrane-fusion protein)
VLRLVRLDRLRVEAFAPARELALQHGQSVAVFIDVPGRGPVRASARLVFISPEVNPVNGQVLLWAEVENPDLLFKPGQTATLEIESASSAHEPLAPNKNG